MRNPVISLLKICGGKTGILPFLGMPFPAEMENQVEALVETARALGNLSRHADARRCIANLRLDEILVFWQPG